MSAAAVPATFGIYATTKQNPFTGYIDELRFSNVARYSGNFTPQWFPYFPSLNGSNDAATRLLLHAENMNDSAAGCAVRGPHPVYFNGTAVCSSAQAKFGTKSFRFDGSTNCLVWLSSVYHFDLEPRVHDWTVDFWYYRVGGSGTVIGTRSTNTQYASWVIVDNGTNFTLYASSSGSAWDAYSAVDIGAIPSGQWVHFALVHSNDLPAASALRSFINGALAKSYNYTQGTSLVSLNQIFSIGGMTDGASCNCYMDEIRFSSVARWTANFTPPTAPYGPDADPTVLLMHFDSTTAVTDSSSAQHGAASVAGPTGATGAQLKFGDGSCAFNGTTGYLTYPYSPDWDLGNGDFTIEYWEYRTDSTNAKAVLVRDGGSPYSGFLVGYASGGNLFFYSSSSNTAWDNVSALLMGPIVLNQWHHFAVVRKDKIFTTYRDGVPIAQATSAGPCGGTAASLYIGYYSGTFYSGYIDELRISKVARWTSQFTPPSAPYTGTESAPTYPDAATVLLVHMDGADGGLVYQDSSLYNKSVLQTNSTKTVTAVKKFGAASMQNIAAGGGVFCPLVGDPDLALGTGDFTIDLWVNPIAVANQLGIIDWRPSTPGGAYPALIQLAGGKVIYWANGATQITSATTMVNGTWYHLAIVRASGVTKLYVNGVNEGAAYTDATNYLNTGTNRPFIGNDGNTSGAAFSGNIDEVRVSKGVARWTANFTPPTVPYS
jgi:hypothetical protein